MGAQEVVGVGVLALVAWAGLSTVRQPPSNIAGKEPIHENPTRLLFDTQQPGDSEGIITFKDPATGQPLGVYAVGIDGRLYENPLKPNTRLEAEFTPSSHFNSPHFDVGGFGGLGDFAGTARPIQVGVRYSPTRLGFGWVAPDLVASTEAVGAGVSIFPTSRTVGYPWYHLGVGAWYMAPWDGGRPGLVLGVSSSIR